MAIAADAAAAPVNGTGTGTTVTSGSISPSGGTLLIVAVQYCSNGQSASSLSDSLGSHLTYTKLIGSATTNAYTDLWAADVPASAPGAFTVTVTMSASLTLTGVGIEVISLSGAAARASQGGTPVTATAATGAPSVTLGSAASDSLVLGSFALKVATAVTIPSGQTDVFATVTENWVNSGVAKQGLIQANSAPGNSNLTINDTAPTGVWGAVVAEIKAGAATPTRAPRRRAYGMRSALGGRGVFPMFGWQQGRRGLCVAQKRLWTPERARASQ